MFALLVKLARLGAGACLLVFASLVLAADPPDAPEAMMLVATPKLTDPLWGATVLVAWPAGDGRHLGFILNKPMTVTLADAFPRHQPSQKARSRIFLGGPTRSNSLFALVRGEQSPGAGSVRIAPDLHAVFRGTTVDEVIEREPDMARFLVGAVQWQRGELEEEIQRGAWFIDPPDTDTLMRKDTTELWRELVQRRLDRRKAI